MTEEGCGKMANFRQNSNPHTPLKHKENCLDSTRLDLRTFGVQKECATTALLHFYNYSDKTVVNIQTLYYLT